MKHYINPENNQIFAYELDGSQDHLIAANFLPISDAELTTLRATNPAALLVMKKEQAKVAVQARLDAFAREKDYDSIISACSYAVSSTAELQAEGQRCSDLRDSTWSAYYAIIAAVDSESRTMPSVEDLVLELPELTWTNV